jgi:hypothetical protein
MKCVLACALLIAGCIDAGATDSLLQPGSVAAFVEQAQPVLTARCASPSCHGNDERPLSLYAVHNHRLDPADRYVDTPLRDDEVRHNFLQAAVFVDEAGEASQCQLLTKALAAGASGARHAHVEVFTDSSEYDYRRLRAWVENAHAAGANP